MKAVFRNFNQMIRQMKRDPMLLTFAAVPILVGLIFRFVIPYIEGLLVNYFGHDVILPYYSLLDIFLLTFTPTMLEYVVAMIMLEESDDNLVRYLAVTPLGKGGYLASRLGITGLLCFPVSILITLIFGLSNLNLVSLVGLAVVASIQGIGSAMIIVTLSANKVEGIAIGKMASLFTLGAIIPYFIADKIQYIFSLFPTFWMAKSVVTGNYSFIIVALLLGFLWVLIFIKRFERKLF